MKRILLSLTILCIGAVLFAQSPQSLKYQTVVRDNANEILDNENVYFRISILQYSDVGTAVYEETFDRTTNDFGLVTFNIGEGTDKTGLFEDIDWSDGPYYVKVEVDIDGSGSTYGYEVTGTSELLSVPYALHALTSEDSFSGDYSELENSPASVQSDTTFYVKLTSAEEDYIDFGTFEGFTNSSDWSIISRLMIPAGTGSTGAYQVFRGKGWLDKEGDIMFRISSTEAYVWLRQGTSWYEVSYSATLNEEEWYDICIEYDASETTLSLYLNGTLVDQNTSVAPQDDSGNTNKLFWGGQDVDPAKGHGNLYLEKDVVISSQHWLQRKLTEDEIINYDGYMEPEADLFFSAKINRDNVTDDSGNGHNGANGNSPEYIYDVYKHTDFADDLYISGDLTVSGNLKVLGNLEVGGTISGSVEIDTIHFSQISGLLGQGYTAVFPQILDNKCTIEIQGITLTDDVVIVSSIGTETERISEFKDVYHDNIIRYRETAGPTMEYPLIFETMSETDMQAVKAWFDEASPVEKDVSVIIKNLAGTETDRWNLQFYLPDGYEPGTDGRTRFTLKHNLPPDNYNACIYENDFGNQHSYNPETDKLFEITDVTHPWFTPAVQVDPDERTVTLTMDYIEGAGIYSWVNDIISGVQAQRSMSLIETTDGTPNTEYQRFNFYEAIPIKYEHFYGFGQNNKLKARVVIAYGFWEESY